MKLAFPATGNPRRLGLPRSKGSVSAASKYRIFSNSVSAIIYSTAPREAPGIPHSLFSEALYQFQVNVDSTGFMLPRPFHSAFPPGDQSLSLRIYPLDTFIGYTSGLMLLNDGIPSSPAISSPRFPTADLTRNNLREIPGCACPFTLELPSRVRCPSGKPAPYRAVGETARN